MPQKRGIRALLKAAFVAGFSAGKASQYWGRVWRELAKINVRGAWRTRTTQPVVRRLKAGARVPSPIGPGFLIIVAIVLVTLTAVFDLGKFLPTQLFIARDDTEARDLRAKILAAGDALIGKPYIYGSTGPDGFDCSGFTIAAYKNAFGYSFQKYGVRTSAQMAAQAGEPVSRADLQPGDLVFFATDPVITNTVTHVAIYVNPDRILHANSYTKMVNYDRFASSTYYNERFLSARRIVKAESNYVPPSIPPSPPQNEPYQELPPSDETRPSDPGIILASTGSFPDVSPDHPYAPAISLLKERNVIGGYPDGSFQPRRTVSRVELLKFAFRAFNISTSATEPPFPDVPGDHWGRGYIATAYANGWVKGPGDGNFYPDNTVTRAEAAKILFKVGGLAFDEPTRKPLYADTARDSWVAPYAAEIKANNLLDSFGVNFEPTLGMNRESVAEFIVRVLKSQGKA